MALDLPAAQSALSDAKIHVVALRDAIRMHESGEMIPNVPISDADKALIRAEAVIHRDAFEIAAAAVVANLTP